MYEENSIIQQIRTSWFVNRVIHRRRLHIFQNCFFWEERFLLYKLLEKTVQMNLLNMFISDSPLELDVNNSMASFNSNRRTGRQIRDKVYDLPLFDNTQRRLKFAKKLAEEKRFMKFSSFMNKPLCWMYINFVNKHEITLWNWISYSSIW